MNAARFTALEPFCVKSAMLKAGEGSGEPSPPVAPAGASGQASPSGGGPPFSLLGLDRLQLAALPGFLALYFLVEREPTMAPLAVLALLACVLYRLDDEKRRVAAVPVILASLMLVGRVSVHVTPLARQNWRATDLTEPALGWLPLFFAACIFLAPDVRNYTGKLMMSISVLLLVSGLLPGDAFKAIFITCQYFLFLALVLGLSLDFTIRIGAASSHT